MAAFSSSGFSTEAFSVNAFFFDAVQDDVVSTGGGSGKRFRNKRKVFRLPDGRLVLATDEEIESLLNPLPGRVSIPSFIEVSVGIPHTNIPYLMSIVREMEEDEEILVAQWLM